MTRRLVMLGGLVAVVALSAGCADAPTGSTSPAPRDASAVLPSGSPSDAANVAATSAASVSAAPSDEGDTTVRPGEAWIVSQRLVDLAVSDVTGIYLVRPDGTGSHRLVPDLDGAQMHPAWSPDGEEVTFIQENLTGTKELWIVGADGTDARAVAKCESPCNNMTVPEWRAADPGGIYVGRDEGLGKFMLSRLDLASGEMVDVVVREDDATAENWRLSPDGTQAAFVRDILTDSEGAAVFVVDLATDKERQLTPYDFSLDRPDWMPDGRIVFNAPSLGVYNDGDAEAANLWVMDADGGNLEQLTHYTEDNSGATQPHVLADGSGIAFTKVLDGTPRRPMGLVDIDGSNDRFLTPNQSRGSHLDIRPLP